MRIERHCTSAKQQFPPLTLASGFLLTRWPFFLPSLEIWEEPLQSAFGRVQTRQSTIVRVCSDVLDRTMRHVRNPRPACRYPWVSRQGVFSSRRTADDTLKGASSTLELCCSRDLVNLIMPDE
jgi:hypothetical protein